MVLLITALFSGLGMLLNRRIMGYIEKREKIDLRDEALNLRADFEDTLGRAQSLVWDQIWKPQKDQPQNGQPRTVDTEANATADEDPVITFCRRVHRDQLLQPSPEITERSEIIRHALRESLPEQLCDPGPAVYWSDLFWVPSAAGKPRATMQMLVREPRFTASGDATDSLPEPRYWLAEVDLTAWLFARVFKNVRCFSLLVNATDFEQSGLCCIPLNNGNPAGMKLLAKEALPDSPEIREVRFSVGTSLRTALVEFRDWQRRLPTHSSAAFQYPQVEEGASTGIRLEHLIEVDRGEFKPPAPWTCRSSEIEPGVFQTLQERFQKHTLDPPSLQDPFRCVRLEAGQQPRIWLRAGSAELLKELQEHLRKLLTEAGADEETVSWDSQTRMDDLVLSVLEVRQPGVAAAKPPLFYLARAVSLEEIRNSAAEGLSPLYLSAALATIGALVLAVLVALRIAQPLQQITEVVRKINPDPNADPRQFEEVLQQLPTERSDEVGVIARQIEKTLHEVMQAGRQIREEVGKKELAEVDRRVAEEANLAKENVLASISHDMRQFVHEVYDRIDLLRDDTLSEHQRQAVEEITASTGKLRLLIDDLLDAHRLRHGDVHIEQDEFAVRKMLEDVVRMYQTEADEKGIRLSLHPGDDVVVCSDRGKLERIVMNLVSNACKFTTAGSIDVQLQRMTNGKFSIAVADTGKGMTPEQQSKVFHQQHTATQKGNRGGTGLGLYICQQLTQRLGGEISFVSRHREGTTFTVTLPQESAVTAGTPAGILANAPNRTPAELPQRIREQHLRLLVVDDSAQARQVIIREARAEFGNAVHIFEAASAAEGLDLLLREHIDLITLDVEMPGMNGFEMLAKLKHNELWRRIPVLMVTVHPDDGRASMLGADGFLSKPVRREELRAAINRVLSPAQSGIVLIVDDDEGCRKDLQRLLEAQGLTVQTAVDGEDAMERIREQLPSLCLIDLLMPRMDGFALIEKLRTMPDTAQIPVFVLSALDLTAEEHRRLAPDVQQFFSKGTADIRAVRTEIQRLLTPRQDIVRTPVVAGVVQ